MSFEIIGVGTILLALGLVILDHCREIRSDLKWLRARFFSDHGRPINLAREFESLSPLYFMPFAEIASEIKRARDAVTVDFERALAYWQDLELQEMEIFLTKKQSIDKRFVTSQAVNLAKRRWLVERLRLDLVNKWEHLFEDVLLGLLSGKSDIADAKHRLECVKRWALLDIGGFTDREFDKNNEDFLKSDSYPTEEKWKNRIEYLREMKELKRIEYLREMRELRK